MRGSEFTLYSPRCENSSAEATLSPSNVAE
jgi:hypothetical protein